MARKQSPVCGALLGSLLGYSKKSPRKTFLRAQGPKKPQLVSNSILSSSWEDKLTKYSGGTTAQRGWDTGTVTRAKGSPGQAWGHSASHPRIPELSILLHLRISCGADGSFGKLGAYFMGESFGAMTNLSWLAWYFLHFSTGKSCILGPPQCWTNWNSWQTYPWGFSRFAFVCVA